MLSRWNSNVARGWQFLSFLGIDNTLCAVWLGPISRPRHTLTITSRPRTVAVILRKRVIVKRLMQAFPTHLTLGYLLSRREPLGRSCFAHLLLPAIWEISKACLSGTMTVKVHSLNSRKRSGMTILSILRPSLSVVWKCLGQTLGMNAKLGRCSQNTEELRQSKLFDQVWFSLVTVYRIPD